MELCSEKEPFSAQLETVLPGLQSWQAATQQAVSAVNQKLDTALQSLSTIQESIHTGNRNHKIFIEESNGHLRREMASTLAQSLVTVAREIVQAAGLVVGGVGGETDKRMTPTPKMCEGLPIRALFPSEEAPIPPPVPVPAVDSVARTSPTAVRCHAQNTVDQVLNLADAVDHRQFRMAPRHEKLTDLYNECCGLDRFHDPHGGMCGRDKSFGSKWRRHMSGREKAHYSRTRRTLAAVESFAAQHKIEPLEACVALQVACESSRCSVANFVKYCQGEGLLTKKMARGKKNSTSNTN